MRGVGRSAVAGTQVGVDAHDLRFLRGEGEDLRTATADDERRVRLLHRLRLPVQLGDRVVLAREAECAVGEQAFEDRDRFGEARDAHARAIELHPGLFVVGRHPSCADAELEPAVRQQIERRGLTREHDGMLVVVAEHERADAERVGHGGRVRKRNRGRQLMVDEVVRHEERRESRGFGAAGELGEILGRLRVAGDAAEAEAAILRHGARMPRRDQRVPVLPHPPRPRADSSSASTTSHSTASTRWTTSCAIRAPARPRRLPKDRCSRAGRGSRRGSPRRSIRVC